MWVTGGGERDAFTNVLSIERRRKSRELEPDTILLSYHKDPKMKHKVSELETIPLREDPKMTHRMSGPPGDLDEGKKRWLTVGICLNSIISPLLRKYVDPIVSNLYSSLVASDSIHTQGYHRYLKNYPGTNRHFLNYESINNNRSVPKKEINSKWINDYQKYDYKVTSHVDLSKLFLQPSMAHYSAIDVSCDLSALLGMVININSFQTVVQSDAEKIRSDIRNPWVHCDFTEWTATKYTESFQLMVQLVKDLKLNNREENMILGELNTWATNGQNFLSGTLLGLEIVNDIHQQTHILREYVLTLCTEADSQVLKVQQELNDLENCLQEIIGN
ncbi:Hypothetical predicted protein [Mytilus galloprovincialis]|uniref:Uncharacterized protein n=1 Tax=Mytilus galloprovincialis TaxID=29158 RepID=A0A8B6CY74_MYTGA|nr:Hypothetical predicted protein [Mytilus galloprovincialis]